MKQEHKPGLVFSFTQEQAGCLNALAQSWGINGPHDLVMLLIAREYNNWADKDTETYKDNNLPGEWPGWKDLYGSEHIDPANS